VAYTEWKAPPATTMRYVDSGLVSAKLQVPSPMRSPAPLESTVQCSGARTRMRKAAFRSGWSKQPKILAALFTTVSDQT
jgi:hypothetical protein